MMMRARATTLAFSSSAAFASAAAASSSMFAASAASAVARPASAAAALSLPCPAAASLSLWCGGRRSLHTRSSYLDSSKRGSKVSSTSVFGGPRLSSAAFAGPIAPAAPDTSGIGLSEQTRAQLLNPITVSRGGSARSAKQHRELHASNPNELNHSLAHYIRRTNAWAELVELAFDHMHHMNHHNLIRTIQKLVKLSPTRQMLDVTCYNKFGRFMVTLETRMVELDTAGLMKDAFMPYHYLRQCLKQMYLAQDRARTAELAVPASTAYLRRGARLDKEAAKEHAEETDKIDRHVADQQAAQEAKYTYGRKDEKSLKMRTRERRAGRAFVSVAHTKREQGSKGSAKRSTPSSSPRPKRV